MLILDEPANGLDPEGIAWIRSLLRDFAGRGGTVLLSSHLLAEVQATFGWMLTGQWSGHGPQIASSAAIWIAVPLAIGAVRTIRRDIH